MAKAKKKYGLDTFNKGYSVDVKETYGDLIYLDTIASERFNYEDTETGAIYDSQAELDNEQPDKNLQKVENPVEEDLEANVSFEEENTYIPNAEEENQTLLPEVDFELQKLKDKAKELEDLLKK